MSIDWKNLFDDSSVLSPNEVLHILVIHYFLNESVSGQLELSVSTYIGDGVNTKYMKLEVNRNIFLKNYRSSRVKNTLNPNHSEYTISKD